MAKQIVTWDSVNKHSSTTLSNDNLSASTSGTPGGARSTIGKSSGKWYLELTSPSNGTFSIGIIDSTFDLKSSTTSLANKQQVRAYTPYSKLKYPEATTYGTTPSANDTYSILLDLDANKLEFYRNGLSVGVSHINLSSLVRPIYILASNVEGYNATPVTANFGATPFKYPIPAGYNSYNTEYSSKFLISSEDKFYSITSKYKDNAIPAMTSNTSPSGIAEASSTYSTFYPWKAFDKIVDQNGWVSANGVLVGWLSYEFTSTVTIAGYSIKSGTTPANRLPKNWTFEGWDGAKWIVLDSRVNEPNFGAEDFRFYGFINKIAYKKYRINVTANQGAGDFLSIGDFGMYEYYTYVSYVQNTESDFIINGMNKGMVIGLNDEFSEKRLLVKINSPLGSGKVFKQKIDTSKIPIKKATIT